MQRPSFSIYDASAGSGKTYMLVKEYLKIILTSNRNDAYRNILAITFTNKAVHEMKSRIVYNLSEFIKDEPDAKANDLLNTLAAETSLSQVQIKNKAQQIIKHIIHNYAAFDILTIDKFTHKVIRAFAHDLGLPITFEVTLETDELLLEAVDTIIAKAGEDETLTKLLVDFTMEKTDEDKSWDISNEIFETGKLIFNENNREEISHFNEKSIAEFIAIKSRLTEVAKNLEQQNQILAAETLALIERHNIDLKSFSRGTFPNHLISIKEGKFNPNNKTFHEPEHITVNKTATDSVIIESIVPELLSQLKVIYKNFEQRDFYRAFLKNITPLSLLHTVNHALEKIQEDQSVLSIAEFNSLIYDQIQNQPAPFIYERLGEKYRHFFIDEFQDTSEMQWKNLIPLIDNAISGESEAGEKGTLMIVGDPKQSIYRWRGGKAEQFIALSKDEHPFKNHVRDLTSLDINYRSYSQIIEFNNSFFKFISQQFEHADYKDLYENHSHQNHNNKMGGYVNLSFLPLKQDAEIVSEDEDLDKNEQYCAATFQTIQKVLALGFTYSDICILTRKRGHGILIANYLTQHNIPLISSETLLIEKATEVQFIINVLRYLKNEDDVESKANMLLYIGKNLQSRFAAHDFILKGLQAHNEFEFEAFFQEFDISIIFNNIRKKSLYEAVEVIISAFIHSNRDNAYLQYFLDIILERDFHKQAGISDFLTFWDKNSGKYSIPSPEGNNAVKIMTIHKSKGLEFPVVIMPFAEENYERSPKNKIWLEADEADFGLSKVLIDNTKAVTGFGENALATFNQHKQEELLDNINILYVALTRAEEQLYVISQEVKPKQNGDFPYSTASFFIEYLMSANGFVDGKWQYEFGNSKKLSKETVIKEQTKKVVSAAKKLDTAAIKIAQTEALLWGTHQQEAIEYGNIIHEILSFIQTEDDIETAISKALDIGLIRRDDEKMVRETIQKIVCHPDLAIYFAGGNKIYNEQNIIQNEGNTIKPDRMVLTKQNEILLLDYKTGMHQQKYQLQLENYESIIEKMNLKVVKKALVYIGKTIEVIHL